MAKGFLYLVTIIDWYSRKILFWRLSNTMDTRFCIEALEAALQHYKLPDIFNSNQDSQFTSIEFSKNLLDRNIRLSINRKGRWVNNVFIVPEIWGGLIKKIISHPVKPSLKLATIWYFIIKRAVIKDSMLLLLMKRILVGRDMLHELDQPFKELACVSNHSVPLLTFNLLTFNLICMAIRASGNSKLISIL